MSNDVNITFDEAKEYTYLKGFAMGRCMPETLQALNFARKAHQNQYRRGGQAYIVHPLTMACQAIAVGIDDDKIIAAILLHDVVEDCTLSLNDLPEEPRISRRTKTAIGALTFVKPACAEGEDVKTYEDRVHFAKKCYYENIAKDDIASLAKIIDRCHNISTMAGAFSKQKLKDYIEETETFVMPLIRSTKDSFPEYQNALFILKYHITSVLDSVKGIMALYESEK